MDGENRKKLTPAAKDQLRELKRSFSQDMYAMAVAHLEDPLEKIKTEGKGDCWLLTIMASFEVKDRNHVKNLSEPQRALICTRTACSVNTFSTGPASCCSLIED